MEPRAAREHVRVARRLGELPRIHAAFREGRLSYSKVRALARVAEAGTEEELVELARQTTAAQLERVCSAMRRASTREADEVHASRFLTWFWEDDGSLSIHGSLSPEDGARLLAALEAGHARIGGGGERPAGRGSAEPPEPPEPRRATNADALVAVAEAALGRRGGTGEPDGHSGGAGVELVVHVDAETLGGNGERTAPGGRCHLEHGPALAPETARRLGCDAAIMAIPERGGEPLSVGRRTRAIPTAIKRALAARDGTCRFPGCENRRYLDAHHIRHWAHGGETSLDNLVRLCRRHHRLLHEGGFSVEVLAGGGLRFRNARSEVIDESPDLPRAGSVLAGAPQARDPAPWAGSGERLDLAHTVSVLAGK